MPKMWSLNELSSRRTVLACAAAGAALLAGCAGLNTIRSEVSTFGEWPSARQPGTYAFERLPSQQARAAETEALESSASAALEKAGFKPADAGRDPDVLVQVGARDSRTVQPLWDDPLWWRGGFGYWRHGPWVSPRWGASVRYDFPRYEREVALLIRDRASGKPLFETRASSEGTTRSDPAVMTAMFEAALTDFPRVGINPRRVDVVMP